MNPRSSSAALLKVRLTPRSSATRVEGWKDGVLRVRVGASPTDNQANTALLELLAKELRIPKSSITIKSGHAARVKTLLVANITAEELLTRWK